MKLENVNQPCFNTTLMGVLRGVLDYYEISVSDAMIYGGTGHAFLINIHDQICPSGPYCWSYDRFYLLLNNLGISMTNLGFFSGDNSMDDRLRIEKKVRDCLDRGHPCSLLNMENQLIPGYEDDHFVTSKPWQNHEDTTPSRLTFGTWEEFTEGIHCSFFTYKKVGELDEDRLIKESLEYALELYLAPKKYTFEPYAGGLEAYDQWIQGVMDGYGSELGHWWNAMVWGECRARAAAYMDEVGARFEDSNEEIREITGAMSTNYRLIASNLETVSDREFPTGRKLSLLKDTLQMEAGQIEYLKNLVEIIK